MKILLLHFVFVQLLTVINPTTVICFRAQSSVAYPALPIHGGKQYYRYTSICPYAYMYVCINTPVHVKEWELWRLWVGSMCGLFAQPTIRSHIHIHTLATSISILILLCPHPSTYFHEYSVYSCLLLYYLVFSSHIFFAVYFQLFALVRVCSLLKFVRYYFVEIHIRMYVHKYICVGILFHSRISALFYPSMDTFLLRRSVLFFFAFDVVPWLITCGMITCCVACSYILLMYVCMYAFTVHCFYAGGKRGISREVFGFFASSVHVLHNRVNQYVADLCCKHVRIVLGL